MNLTLCKVLIPIRNYLLLRLHVLLVCADLEIHFVVRIVCHVTGRHIFGVTLNSLSSPTIDSTERWAANNSLVRIPLRLSSSSSATTHVLGLTIADCPTKLVFVVSLHFDQ